MRAGGITAAGLIAGAVVGSALQSWLRVDIVPIGVSAHSLLLYILSAHPLLLYILTAQLLLLHILCAQSLLLYILSAH